MLLGWCVVQCSCCVCRSELLRGPLYYVLVLMAATTVYWRDSPVGVVAMSLMCGGDGLADVVGRRLGQGNRLPWNPAKSWAGSAAMLLGESPAPVGGLQVSQHPTMGLRSDIPSDERDYSRLSTPREGLGVIRTQTRRSARPGNAYQGPLSHLVLPGTPSDSVRDSGWFCQSTRRGAHVLAMLDHPR